MKRLITLLVCGMILSWAVAQSPYVPPDYYPNDVPLRSAGFPVNEGQVMLTNGDPATEVAYYSEGLSPQLFMQEGSRMSFVIAAVDTSAGTEDTLRLWPTKWARVEQWYP